MLSYQLTIIVIIIIFIISVLYILDNRLKNYKIIINQPNNQQINQPKSYDIVKHYDEEKLFNPFEAPAKRPERIQMGYQPINKISNNPLEPYATRGYPDNYHIMGTLTTNNDIDEYNKLNQDNRILSLFGRQKYPGSNEYEYYTMLSTGNVMTKVNIDNNKELFNDDEVFIKEINKTYKVNLYKNEEMKYNPFVY